jgi:S-adenosylmethionine decarboxylase
MHHLAKVAEKNKQLIKSTKQKMIGYHTIWDVSNCAINKISWKKDIEQALNAIVALLNLKKVSEAYKQFEPVGVTGFILLEESHISIHTWPEHKYAAIDIFSCRSFDVHTIDVFLKHYFETEDVFTKTIERGMGLSQKMLAPVIIPTEM